MCTIALLLAICSQCFASSGIKINVSITNTVKNVLATIPPGVGNRICGAIHYSDCVL